MSDNSEHSTGGVLRPFKPSGEGSTPSAPTKAGEGKVASEVGMMPGQVGATLLPNPELRESSAGAPPHDAKRRYDSTLARIAGNVASGYVSRGNLDPEHVANVSIAIARKIIEKLEAPSEAGRAAR
jgi:hypothetical protein